MSKLLIGEAVLKGHPDKVADQISDHIVDALLQKDSEATIACDVLLKGKTIVVAGEITTSVFGTHSFDLSMEDFIQEEVKKTRIMKEYTNLFGEFKITNLITPQSRNLRTQAKELKAADQGIIRGAAFRYTKTRLPLAHDLAIELASALNESMPEELGPDGKCMIVVEKDSYTYPRIKHISVSLALPDTQERTKQIAEDFVYGAIQYLWGYLFTQNIKPTISINPPNGLFLRGGPIVDTGLTGRKTVFDAYGIAVSGGGGAFSGKDPSKIDRSMAYATRWVALNILSAFSKINKAIVDVSFEMGDSIPKSFTVYTDPEHEKIAADLDFFINLLRVPTVINMFSLKRPIGWCYEDTAICGHFGNKSFPWEQV